VPWGKTRRAAVLAGAVAALALTVGLFAVTWHGSPAPEPHDGPAPLAAPAAAVMAPEMLDLLVRVSPPGAQIAIDGVPLGSNPFRGRFQRDGLVHHVGASADGYETKLEDITFAGDVSIDLSLDRHAAPIVRWISPPTAHTGKHSPGAPASSSPAAEAPAPPPPPAPAPVHADVGPAGGHAPLRPIVTSNPYGSP